MIRPCNYLLTMIIASGCLWTAPLGAQDSARIAEFLQRRDENRNGQIDPDEWQASRFRQVYEAAGKEAGLDLTRPIPMEKMDRAVRTYSDKNGGNVFGGGWGGGPPGGGFGGGGWGGGPPGGGFGGGGFGPPGGGWGGNSWGSPSSSSSSSSSSDRDREKEREKEKNKSNSYKPGVPGFGEKIELPPIAGFGSALDSVNAVASASGSDTRSSKDKERDSKDSRSNDERKDQSREEKDKRDREERERRERDENRKFAKSIIEQNDKNKDGVLSKNDNEWGNLKGDPSNADYNKDGMITVDEMTERLIERSKDQSSGWGRGSTSSSSSKPATGTNGKPIRFLTPTERLPEGMPSWFTRADTNGDGQVSMAEYSTKWDDAKLSEYTKYDLNNDGLITATECLTVEKSRSSSSSSSGSSRWGSSSSDSSRWGSRPPEAPSKPADPITTDPAKSDAKASDSRDKESRDKEKSEDRNRESEKRPSETKPAE
jgi:hypothetical protein